MIKATSFLIFFLCYLLVYIISVSFLDSQICSQVFAGEIFFHFKLQLIQRFLGERKL